MQTNNVFKNVLSDIKTLEVLRALINNVETSKTYLYKSMSDFRGYFEQNIERSFVSTLFSFLDSMNISDPIIIEKILNELIKNLHHVLTVQIHCSFLPSEDFITRAHNIISKKILVPFVICVNRVDEESSFAFEFPGLKFESRYADVIQSIVVAKFSL